MWKGLYLFEHNAYAHLRMYIPLNLLSEHNDSERTNRYNWKEEVFFSDLLKKL